MNEQSTTDELATIVELSRFLGSPSRSLAILAEGNTSVRTLGGEFLVKASGTEMGSCTTSDFVRMDLDTLLGAIASDATGDDHVSELLAHARRGGGERASVETMLHAVCLEYAEVASVGHTHPVSVNALLCSTSASLLTAGSLFPDQVVVLGRHRLLVDYHDPGLVLAREVRGLLRDHVTQHGRVPKVIYLRNHGMFALGASPDEVKRITLMAEKCAQILLQAPRGEVVFLSELDTARIDERPDELYRRERLGQPL